MNGEVFHNIDAASEIELSKHGVIEASAGTGKTFTLIELVMRLLIEKLIPLEQILLVTFTEQATTELKTRIRDRIKDAGNQEDLTSQQKTHLQSALLQLNQAAIYTIHGFCQRSLKEFAFEQSALFETELVNDNDIYQQTLQRIKRHWVNDEKLLNQINRYLKDKKFQSIDQLLLDLAKKYRADTDEIYPDDTVFSETAIWQALSAIDFTLMSVWESEFQQLKGLKPATFKTNWQSNIKPALELLHQSIVNKKLSQASRILVEAMTQIPEKQFFKGAPAIFDDSHSDSQLTENLKIAPNLFVLIEQLKALTNSVETFDKVQAVQFIPPLVREINHRVKQHKSNHGLISYDDMISDLWHQLQQESGLNEAEQSLTQALQNKYQVALIDEFQDTDIRQWEIFKQIFLTGSKHRLWVIGDPKQAIYSFRGADVNTYHRAKAEILNQYQGKAYRLSTNYRTTKDLIEPLNAFFAKDELGGWFDASTVMVKAADKQSIAAEKLPAILQQPTGLNPLSQLQTRKANADVMRKDLAEQIAQTIKYQLLNQVTFQVKGHKKIMDAGDVCILVRSKSDAKSLEEMLQKYQLPYTYYKKQDLYHSIEAIHFEVMLTALAYPHHIKRVNNALVSLFFDLSADQLQQFSEEKHIKYNALWLEIKEAVSMKNWIKVFDLLLYDTGAMLRYRHQTRRIANIKQLKHALLTEAMQKNLEAKGLLKAYQNWRANKPVEEALHHKDTEQAAIQIMTMHTSKGLEFPVVFLFCGFSKRSNDGKFFSFFDVNKQKTIYDLTKTHQKIHDQQALIEAQQLFYVAMTRAVFMLFVPNCVGEISQPNVYAQTMFPRIEQLNLPVHQPTTDIKQAHSPKEQPINPPLQLPQLPENIQQRQRTLHSFSSLSRMKSQGADEMVESQFAIDLAAELALTESSNRINESFRTAQEIPGGVKTGLVLHGIFENIDFNRLIGHDGLTAVYSDDALMQVIDEQMKFFKLENKPLLDEAGIVFHDYRKQLADWVWHTLRKPLDALNGQCIGNVPASKRYHELAFYWNHEKTNLTGFIDLLFSVDNDSHSDYYILDWKSNLSLNGYSPDILSSDVMQKHQYQWQYQLYALAMQHWFDSLQLENARLKGAIYLFSRGMDCQEAAQNGVFYEDFTRAPWNTSDIQTELLAMNNEVKL